MINATDTEVTRRELLALIGRPFRDRRVRDDQSGLALLDALLGMAIFALVVIIGVQNFSTLRGRAYVTAVSSDVKQVATVVEESRINDDAYAEALPPLPDGVNLTPGVSVARYARTANGSNFSVCAEHEKGPWAVYDSIKGTVTASGSTDGCAASALPPNPDPTDEPTEEPTDPGACDLSAMMIDHDGDGFSTSTENGVGWDPCDPANPIANGSGPNGDADGDGFLNRHELGSDPLMCFTFPAPAFGAAAISSAHDANVPVAGGYQPNADSDGDGLTNADEISTWGCSTWQNANAPWVGGASGDADSDGVPNGLEYLQYGPAAVTNPNVPVASGGGETGSTPIITGVSRAGGTITITGTNLTAVQAVVIPSAGGYSVPFCKTATTITVNGAPPGPWAMRAVYGPNPATDFVAFNVPG